MAVVLGILLVAVLGSLILLRRPLSPRPNVLLITMDSLRPDHLGCYDYARANTPNIDALAQDGVIFMEAIAQATFTHISVPSMITGKYPTFTRVKSPAAHLDSSHITLAEVLQEQGYFTYGIVANWNESFNQGFEQIHSDSQHTLRKTELCLEALDQLDDHPFFIWLYYWDPHAPYAPPAEFMRVYEAHYTWEDGKSYSRPSRVEKNENLRDPSGFYGGTPRVLVRINEGKIVLTQAEREHLINLYDAEITFVDSNIKEVLDKIKELGLWENTMVVLNADHGEAFGEHGRYYHGRTIYEEQVRVPLIIKPPQSLATGKAIHGPVRNLDIMPTILDYCDIQTPAEIQGQSLRPFIINGHSPNLPTCLETFGYPKGKSSIFQLIGYRQGEYKLIFDLVADRTELYHLYQDPGETNDLLAEGEAPLSLKEREAELRADLLKSLNIKRLAGLKLTFRSMDKMDRNARQRLRALGYIY